jgi:hypothetical protein
MTTIQDEYINKYENDAEEKSMQRVINLSWTE